MLIQKQAKETIESKYDVQIFFSNGKETKGLLSYVKANNALVTRREIYVGPFDSADNELAAIYHELGHVLLTHEEHLEICAKYENYTPRANVVSYGKFGYWRTAGERLAWRHGISAAQDDGVEFSLSMLRYAAERLRTHYKYNG